jgi:DNA-binding protein HU-beta
MINCDKFAKGIAEYTGYSQKNIKEVLEAAEMVMIDNIKKGEDVKVFKSVTISTSKIPARSGINPFTKEKMEIPEGLKLRAKFSKKFKDLINNKDR